jgi:acyl-CoA thioesterase YciA
MRVKRNGGQLCVQRMPIRILGCEGMALQAQRKTIMMRRRPNMAIEPDEPRGELTVRTIAMPADTNANGDIFGGWVLSQMDLAGGIAGVDRSHGRVVTVALDAMHFIAPVKVGDVLCVYTQVDSVGRTSMKIHVEAWVRRFESRAREKVTDALFTFVAIDEAGKPRPVPR